MAYIGRNPAIGTQKVLDSLESQFNGTLTTFDLRYLGNTIYPPIASALIVSLGGVLQEPGVAYTVASDTITFASAPPTGADCWILLYTEFGGTAGATANLTVSNNLTIGNELHGPANFVIDPATIGDNTGTVEIKGNLTVQGTQTTVNSTTVDLDHLSLGDNEIANFGDGNDLQIYHDGSDSYINDTGTGALQVRTSALILRSNVGENMAFAYSNGAVQLYHNNSQKFATTSTGIDVTGLTDTDTLNVSGTSTFNDDVRIIDDKKLRFGTSNANGGILQIYTNGTNSFFKQTSGDLKYELADQFIVQKDDGDEPIAIFTADGSVELYYDNSKKIETTSTGVTVTGALEVSAATNITVGGTALPSLTGLLGGSLDGTLGTVTMAYLPSAPNSPVQGQFYFNSLNQKAQIYTGSSFVDLVPSGGGGGGGAGTTDAQATFRKYTYSITSTTNAVSGSSDTVVTAGDFVVGNVYTIKTIGTTDFTAIGASANTVGVEFTATGAGTGTGDAYDTLYYATGGIQNIEVYVNGVKSVEGSSNDYVATTGTSVNFTSNLASGDVVDIQVYELLTNDAYVLASGGTFTGNVGINTSTINNRLHIHSDANEQGILLTQGGDNYSAIISNANRSGADKYVLNLEGQWNGSKVARIALETGDDTTNKDDGRIKFFTSAASGNIGVAMRIEPDKKIGIGGDHDPLSPLHIRVNTATLLRLERSGNTNAAIRYENDTSQMYAGLSSSATFFGIGTSENIASTGTQLCVTRADGNVGIGNTAPVNRLQVSGGDATFDNNRYIGFNIYHDDTWRQVGTGNAAVLKHHSTNGFQLYTGADSGNGAGGTASVGARVTVDNNGNVGIGTADPDNGLGAAASPSLSVYNGSGARLGLWGNGSRWWYIHGEDSNTLQIGARTSSNTVDSDYLTISTAGNVGIGTVTPPEKLSVHGTGVVASFGDLTNVDQLDIVATSGYPTIKNSSSADTLQLDSLGSVKIAIDSNNNSTESFEIVHGGKDAGGNRIMYIDESGSFEVSQVNAGWTNSTDHPILMWDFKSGVGDMMYMASGGNTTIANQMALVVSDAHGFKVGRSGWDGTEPDISSSNEFLRIKTDGNVGIGINNPTRKLEVGGDILYHNNAIIASYPDANNIDHIWHNDNAYAGTGGSWNFCSDTTYKATGNSGIRMGGKLGVGATPSGTPAGLNAFIAIGDTDTGIGQDGDGQLELWANNQEILHLNTSEVNLLKDFRCGGGTGLPGYNNTTQGVYMERSNGAIFAYRTASFSLHLGRSNNGEVLRIKKNNSTQAGTLQITSNSTVALVNGSDYRLKTNIEEIPNAVSSFRQLKPCQFEYISEPGEIFQGFIAHELQEVNPKFASGVKDEVDENGDIVEQGVDTRNLVPLLTAALQEAFNMIDNLQEQINQLSNP